MKLQIIDFSVNLIGWSIKQMWNLSQQSQHYLVKFQISNQHRSPSFQETNEILHLLHKKKGRKEIHVNVTQNS